MHLLDDINARYIATFADHPRLVLGSGAMDARIVLVGEAPGAQEEASGRPFVGKAGKNLDVFLDTISLPREALYITNAVKFRPTKQGASGRLSNRTPTKQEIAAFRPLLLEEIAAISPEWIVTLGNTALFSVSGEVLSIGECHGKPLSTQAGRVFPLYHPASIIYRRELEAVYRQDLLALGRHCTRRPKG